MGIGSSPVASEGSRGGGAPLGSLYRRAGSGSAAAYISPHYTGDRSLVLYLPFVDILGDEAPASGKATPPGMGTIQIPAGSDFVGNLLWCGHPGGRMYTL